MRLKIKKDMKGQLLFFLFVLVSLLLFLHPIDASDFFHHIATGRDIVTTGKLPYLDTHTFTAYGSPWIAHSWGSGLAYYLTYQILGTPGVNMLFSILGVGTVVFMAYVTKKFTRLSFFSWSLLLLTSGTLSLYWPSRPLVMGPFFLAALLLILKSNSKYLKLLPIFFWVWAIFYGASALLGLFVFLIFLMTTKNHLNKINMFIWLLSFIAASLNGYGLKSLFYGFGSSMYFQPQEWLPVHKLFGLPLIPLANHRLLVYFGWLIITITFLIYVFKSKRELFREYLFESLLTLGVFLPFVSFRYISLVPIFVLPFLTLSFKLMSKKLQGVTSGALLVFAISIMVIRLTNIPIGFGMFDPEAGKPLLDAIDFMKQHQIYGNVYTSQNLGPHIYWSMPESKVFFDTRDDLFINTDIYSDLGRVFNGEQSITAILNKYEANIVIGRPAAIYQPLLHDPEWNFIYKKEYFVATRVVK